MSVRFSSFTFVYLHFIQSFQHILHEIILTFPCFECANFMASHLWCSSEMRRHGCCAAVPNLTNLTAASTTTHLHMDLQSTRCQNIESVTRGQKPTHVTLNFRRPQVQFSHSSFTSVYSSLHHSQSSADASSVKLDHLSLRTMFYGFTSGSKWTPVETLEVRGCECDSRICTVTGFWGIILRWLRLLLWLSDERRHCDKAAVTRKLLTQVQWNDQIRLF